MRALLAIDIQNAIVETKYFKTELKNIEAIIQDFEKKNDPVIFVKNLADDPTSPFHAEKESSAIHSSIKKYAKDVIEKKTPSAFFQTNLAEKLEALNVEHLFIVGFNAEFCCQFTAIAAYDRGYKVTFIEEATGTVNDAEIYEMEGLDIRDFVGTVLHWSNVIEVLDQDEYRQTYMGSSRNG